MDENVLTNMAKTLKVEPDVLRTRATTVMEEQGTQWLANGKSESDCEILALRVAGRTITTENARLRRSGATIFEGMFLDVPRTKLFGEWGYKRMRNQLTGMTDEVKESFVQQKKIVLLEDNHDGTYTRNAHEDFGGASDISALPNHTMRLDENTHFYLVWEGNNRTFPSGDDNFKFGAPRPQDDRARRMLFYGRQQGSSDACSLYTVTAQGKAADIQHPTFVAGRIPLNAGKNNNAYAKPNISVLTPDESLQSIFDSPPVKSDGDGGYSGLIPELSASDTFDWLGSLMDLEPYYMENHGGGVRPKDNSWYNKKQAVVTEVIHIDPRTNGGLVLMCADMDITSTAPSVDVYISSDVDFGVGTKLLVIGETWRTEEGEQRLTVNGWYAFDEVQPAATNIYGESIPTSDSIEDYGGGV